MTSSSLFDYGNWRLICSWSNRTLSLDVHPNFPWTLVSIVKRLDEVIYRVSCFIKIPRKNTCNSNNYS